MPLPPPPANLLAQIQAKKGNKDGPKSTAEGTNNALLAAIQKRQADASAATNGVATKKAEEGVPPSSIDNKNMNIVPDGKLFIYNSPNESFQFDLTSPNAVQPHVSSSTDESSIIVVPLAPCVYRMTDYTYSKKEPILLSRCVNKLGVLRCLANECKVLNKLLEARLDGGGTIEESELGKVRFMELLSNCGVYQKISELIIGRCNAVSDRVAKEGGEMGCKGVQVVVEGLSDFLQTIEELVPALAVAREEIATTQTVSFHPGLGELFRPGAQLICHPDGMEGTALGVSCVQSWYDEELNRATNKVKRRFILVVEFVVSVGTELVFVAASEVYPEFHDVNRSIPIRDLNHRRIDPTNNEDDASLIQRLQERGEFYASVSVDNHYLEYHPNAFFPIIGGWGNNAVRPLSKSGRVMVDVHRGQLEGHIPIRGSSDGMSDTVKEAMKLFDQSKRTGVAVPFRTAILPEFTRSAAKSLQDGSHERGDSDRHHLWMSWVCSVVLFTCCYIVVTCAHHLLPPKSVANAYRILIHCEMLGQTPLESSKDTHK